MTTRPGPIADRLSAASSLDLADDPSTVDTIASALESTSLGRGTRLTIAKAAQANFVYAMLAAHSRDVTKRLPAGLLTPCTGLCSTKRMRSTTNC